ncbi:multi-component transcriptional winged helix family [Leptolyngbya sp. Heron Island J]|uniref:response regulator n=1 Tax=Leptolyngbya sp. Heron Island J TaxID=1385935 RepID=UPI0003B9AA6B|nr:response regulator [Leptolyngbya sp. Heron Island J]ESA37448.1 multi-component transcriptional winged helix family [Leptolyngbya sp. Heron Island J]
MRLLLIDDDEVLMETLAARLIKQRYAVDIASNGEMAQEFLDLFAYDLIVLDMLLPDIDGITLCKTCRQQHVNCPILMLTAKDESQDKVKALDAGADDYVVKPFDFEELCARIRALLRRDGHDATPTLKWGDLSIAPETFEIFYGNHQLHVTPKEYALLELFIRHPNRVFSLDAIIDNLWAFEDPPSGDAVRTHIKGVRQKLKAGGAPKNFIETVYGLGYRLRALEAMVPSEANKPVPDSKSLTQADMEAAIAKAWVMHQDTMQERLTVLEAAVAALGSDGQLSPELQHAGRSQAHKLAGSLGCFGFAEGSRLARKLEQLLQLDVPLDNEQVFQMTSLVEGLKQNLASGGSQQAVSAAMASTPQILLLGAGTEFSQSLITLGAASGLRIVACPDLSQAKPKLQEQPSDGLVIWLPEVEPTNVGLTDFLEHLAKEIGDKPLLVISDVMDFRQRLIWVQQGVDRILPKSTSPQQVIKALKQLLQEDQTAAKVMIVDDDIQVLDFLKTILSPWGFQLTTLTDSTQLLQALETVQPNLLVLDVEMPEVNGLELCQVLRADDRWQQLPILFLTVHEDIPTKQDAFKVGANDFISKSVMVTELPMRILSRLQHVQA